MLHIQTVFILVSAKQALFDTVINEFTLAILSNHDDPTGIASSLDSRIEKVIKHYVDIPQSGFQEGDIVPIIVKLYLGQTEIKVNVVIDSENATKWAKINNRQISKQESFHNKPVASEKNDSSKLR